MTDKITVHRYSGKCRICFRCAMPLEWLQDAITDVGKQQYNAVLERIHRGELWLKGNTSDPRYEENYAKFLVLFDDLRILYNAVGETLAEPFAMYSQKHGA